VTARRATRVCRKTGLQLVRPPSQTVWRLARGKYGPLNPQHRPSRRPSANPDEWKLWHRWDVPGHRTVYAGDSRQTAYSEVLAWFRRKLSEDAQYFDLAPYLDPEYPDEDFWETIEREFDERGHWHPGYLPRGWRDDRTCYELALPMDGFFVDVAHAESMEAAARGIRSELQVLDVEEVDLPLLTGDRREVTCAVAAWVHGLVLDDGSLPQGIRYPSRLGAGENWAVWLRRIDDGHPVDSEPTKMVGSAPVELHDPDFLAVLKRYGLKTH
jgi:hypothetical protein